MTEDADHPLHAAIVSSDIGAIRYLLSSGEDPNVENFDGMVPLSTLATYSGSVEIARLLLEAGADPDAARTFLPPLVYAAATGHGDLVCLLLESGANPSIHDGEDYSALMYSLIRKDCDLALKLLSYGADLRLVNREGKDARMYAEEAGCQEVLKRIDQILKRDRKSD